MCQTLDLCIELMGEKKYLWVPDSFLVSINGRDSFQNRVICSRISHSNLL
jgi:hypothetical protein